MKLKFRSLSTLALGLLFIYSAAPSFAGEDLGTTAKNSASDVSTAGKKTGRWASRQARKITGKDSQTQDQKDRMLNRQDDLQNEVNKTGNRDQENE